MINTIIQGDCLEVMRGMADNSVDLVLTDPPYGIGMKYDTYDDSWENWRDVIMGQIIPECIRVSQMVIMPSCRMQYLPWIYKNLPPDWLICWYKGSPGTAAYVGFNDWEPLLVYGKRKGISMHDYFHATPEPFDNGHPCPKPIKWAKWLIERASKPDDIILDPFTGSGTTCAAADIMGRRYIGIEISEEYCKIARKRVQEAKDSMGLFNQ